MRNVEAADIAAAMMRQAIREAPLRHATVPKAPITTKAGIVPRTATATGFCGEAKHQSKMSPVKATAGMRPATHHFMWRLVHHAQARNHCEEGGCDGSSIHGVGPVFAGSASIGRASQTFTLWSLPADARRVPSLLNAMAWTSVSPPTGLAWIPRGIEREGLEAGPGVPQLAVPSRPPWAIRCRAWS